MEDLLKQLNHQLPPRDSIFVLRISTNKYKRSTSDQEPF